METRRQRIRTKKQRSFAIDDAQKLVINTILNSAKARRELKGVEREILEKIQTTQKIPTDKDSMRKLAVVLRDFKRIKFPKKTNPVETFKVSLEELSEEPIEQLLQARQVARLDIRGRSSSTKLTEEENNQLVDFLSERGDELETDVKAILQEIVSTKIIDVNPGNAERVSRAFATISGPAIGMAMNTIKEQVINSAQEILKMERGIPPPVFPDPQLSTEPIQETMGEEFLRNMQDARELNPAAFGEFDYGAEVPGADRGSNQNSSFTQAYSGETHMPEFGHIPFSHVPSEDSRMSQSDMLQDRGKDVESGLIFASQMAQQNMLLKANIGKKNSNRAAKGFKNPEVTFEEWREIIQNREMEAYKLKVDELSAVERNRVLQEGNRLIDQQVNANRRWGIPLVR